MGELVREFERRATKVASDYFIPGADRDDLVQEARIGIFKAVLSYDPVKPASFVTFLDMVVRRNVITAVKTATRMKHGALTHAIRVARSEEDGYEMAFDAIDVLEAPNADAHALLVDRERSLHILRVVRDELSPLERASIVGFANGNSYLEIEQSLVDDHDRPGRAVYHKAKVVDNAIERARRKIKLALREADALPLGVAA